MMAVSYTHLDVYKRQAYGASYVRSQELNPRPSMLMLATRHLEARCIKNALFKYNDNLFIFIIFLIFPKAIRPL